MRSLLSTLLVILYLGTPGAFGSAALPEVYTRYQAVQEKQPSKDAFESLSPEDQREFLIYIYRSLKDARLLGPDSHLNRITQGDWSYTNLPFPLSDAHSLSDRADTHFKSDNGLIMLARAAGDSPEKTLKSLVVPLDHWRMSYLVRPASSRPLDTAAKVATVARYESAVPSMGPKAWEALSGAERQMVIETQVARVVAGGLQLTDLPQITKEQLSKIAVSEEDAKALPDRVRQYFPEGVTLEDGSKHVAPPPAETPPALGPISQDVPPEERAEDSAAPANDPPAPPTPGRPGKKASSIAAGLFWRSLKTREEKDQYLRQNYATLKELGLVGDALRLRSIKDESVLKGQISLTDAAGYPERVRHHLEFTDKKGLVQACNYFAEIIEAGLPTPPKGQSLVQLTAALPSQIASLEPIASETVETPSPEEAQLAAAEPEPSLETVSEEVSTTNELATNEAPKTAWARLGREEHDPILREQYLTLKELGLLRDILGLRFLKDESQLKGRISLQDARRYPERVKAHFKFTDRKGLVEACLYFGRIIEAGLPSPPARQSLTELEAALLSEFAPTSRRTAREAADEVTPPVQATEEETVLAETPATPEVLNAGASHLEAAQTLYDELIATKSNVREAWRGLGRSERDVLLRHHYQILRGANLNTVTEIRNADLVGKRTHGKISPEDARKFTDRLNEHLRIPSLTSHQHMTAYFRYLIDNNIPTPEPGVISSGFVPDEQTVLTAGRAPEKGQVAQPADQFASGEKKATETPATQEAAPEEIEALTLQDIRSEAYLTTVKEDYARLKKSKGKTSPFARLGKKRQHAILFIHLRDLMAHHFPISFKSLHRASPRKLDQYGVSTSPDDVHNLYHLAEGYFEGGFDRLQAMVESYLREQPVLPPTEELAESAQQPEPTLEEPAPKTEVVIQTEISAEPETQDLSSEPPPQDEIVDVTVMFEPHEPAPLAESPAFLQVAQQEDALTEQSAGAPRWKPNPELLTDAFFKELKKGKDKKAFVVAQIWYLKSLHINPAPHTLEMITPEQCEKLNIRFNPSLIWKHARDAFGGGRVKAYRKALEAAGLNYDYVMEYDQILRTRSCDMLWIKE